MMKLRCSVRHKRAVPQIFTEVRPREGGLDRQKDVGWPVDRLDASGLSGSPC